MVLELQIPSALSHRLEQEAQRQGLQAGELTLRLLEERLPAKDTRQEIVALIESWIEADDVEEQKETGAFLVKALDEDRPSQRPLFVPELKGTTW